jgi:hypothetical protein
MKQRTRGRQHSEEVLEKGPVKKNSSKGSNKSPRTSGLRKLYFDVWNVAIEKKQIVDISNELPDSFLMFGQKMRALVLYEGKKYYATAWDYDKQVMLVPYEEKECGK